MKVRRFKGLLASLKDLTGTQIEEARRALGEVHQKRASIEAIEQARPVGCRHCGSEHVVRNGTRCGLQRWLCRACNRSSSATTGTPLSRLRRKHKFEAYARCLEQGMTIRQAAETVGICVDTAFRWRHRFLETAVGHQPHAVAGMLEVDETYFPYSEKGARHLARAPRRRGGAKGRGSGRRREDWVPVLVGRGRGLPATTDCVLERMTGKAVTEALSGVVTPGETVVCTDGHSAFLGLQHSLNVATKSFVASEHGPVLDRVYHVQTVNQYHGALKGWIQGRLRGVATKYLPHYLAWMRLKSWDSRGVSPPDIVASALGKQVINL
jgi:transposase-like protein